MKAEFSPLSRSEIIQAVVTERERQDNLFGNSNADVSPLDFMWASIVAEQNGKAFSALNYCRRNNSDMPDPAFLAAYEQELVKTAASAVQAIEKIQALKQSIQDRLETQASDVAQPQSR